MSIALPVLSQPGAERQPVQAGSPPPAPTRAHAMGVMVDSYGRVIRDLRLSITDRCNFRCVYCMEPDIRFMDRSEALTVEEIVRLARVCMSLGVEKIRITGGEPTVHPELARIISGLAALGPSDLALTTNGSLMGDGEIRSWRAAGLDRVSISIDSVRPERFSAVTRSRTPVETVFRAVEAAVRGGLNPVKLNAVVIRRVNDDEVADLAGLARRFGVEMRFIEFMPLDSAHGWDMSRVVPASEIVSRIERAYPLVPLGREGESSTSLVYRFSDGAPGRIGVIAPVSRPFCGACSRLRITADGKVRPCLFSRREWNIRRLLRDGAGDERLRRFLVDATWTKQAGHGIRSPGFAQPARPMSAIGG